MMKLIETIVGLLVAIVMGVFLAIGYAVKGLSWVAKTAFSTESSPPGLPGTGDEEETTPTGGEHAKASPIPVDPTIPLAPAPANPSPERRIAVGPRTASTLRTVADFHVSVQFSDSFTASVSVYKNENMARRKIRAISPAAVELMRTLYLRESFDLPDVNLVNGVTYEDAVLDTESIGIKFIEDLLSSKGPRYFNLAPPAVVVGPGTKDVYKPAPVADPEASARALAILRGELAGSEGAKHEAAVNEPAASSSHATVKVEQKPKRPARAFTVGRVVEFGMRKMMFQSNGGTGDGDAVFEALIDCEGECTSLRGVRLQELFTENNVSTGDSVEIISLGRTRVTLAGGEQKFRNEFQLKVLERA
ncbi:hypothetical protein Rfer_4276 (plasmid) [Rhodoferax ferrireducens T118]|uniref:Uncharacterized protein n=2 Tax=Rhodoferax ferrireducens TaxID=192843 RepID=Q21QI2_ALBFT|nr:hypothetical protein Rfer_4276 [Rhodoferax ferrireducens T118]